MLAAAGFFFGSFSLVPLLPTGFVPPDDLSQTQVALVPAARQHLRPDLADRRAGAPYRRKESAREDGLYRRRRRRRRQRSLRPARRGRGAQGDADHQHDAAPANAAASGNRRRAPVARGAGRAARRPGQGRPRRIQREKYILVLASENGESAHRTRPHRRARIAHHSRHRQHRHHDASLVRPELVVRPDFARMADLGVTSAAIADTLRIATAGDYDQSLAKLNLSAAAGPHRRQPAAGRAPGHRPARTADRPRQERPGGSPTSPP
jgi:multidrug efflux pump subunit AcrB